MAVVNQPPKYSGPPVLRIRGVCYDVSDFMHRHPGGKFMLDLSIGRDATIMFESAHCQREKAEMVLKMLPVVTEVPADLDGNGGDFPKPADSPLYESIRKRVVTEVLRANGYKHARGVPLWHWLTVLVTQLTACYLFLTDPAWYTGLLLGWALVWTGTGLQHTANHGCLTRWPALNYLLGLTDDLFPGGSSLVWRYHHQVSHHAYCNDTALDQDVFSSFPLMRFDESMELKWFHRFQWFYGNLLFCLMYPSIEMQDVSQILHMSSFHTEFSGTPKGEKFIALFLKAVHVLWLWVLPLYWYGFSRMLVPYFFAVSVGGWLLAVSFVVSHNVEECKTPEAATDWGLEQITTSTSWGGAIASFFWGGLNLQIEHHLFPCVAHNLYPLIQPIVEDECKKAGVQYNKYHNLVSNYLGFVRFLYNIGQPKRPLASQAAH